MTTQALPSPDRVLAFVIEYKQLHDGLSPSTREIAEALDFSSTSLVNWRLHALERDGKISLLDGRKGIKVVGGQWRLETKSFTV